MPTGRAATTGPPGGPGGEPMPRIGIAFEIEGTTIPHDHGSALDSALGRFVPPWRRDGRIVVL